MLNSDQSIWSTGWWCLLVLTLCGANIPECSGIEWYPDCPNYPGGGSITELPTLNMIPAKLQSVLDTIAALVEGNVTAGLLPGAGLEINYAGVKLLSQGFGLADKENEKEWSVDETFTRIASVTKILPSLLLYQAHASKSIDMHAPVSESIIDFQPINPFDTLDQVNWYQMASQTSGLEREEPVECVVADCSNADALKLLGERFLTWSPGTQPAYSNWAFSLLGNLLSEEILDDTDFGESVSKRITMPMSLHSTGLEYTKEVLDSLAVGYDTEGEVAEFIDLHYAAPAGAAYSSVADLTLLAQTLLAAYHGEEAAASRLGLPISLARLMLRSPAFWNDDFASAGPTGFGTPWELASIKNFFVAFKGGNLPGYATIISMIPTLNVSVVMAMNTDANDMAWLQTIHDLLLPALNETLIDLEQTTAPSPCPHMQDVVGAYLVTDDDPEEDDITVHVQQGGSEANPMLLLTVQVDGEEIIRGALDYVPQKAIPNQLLFRFVYPASARQASCFYQELQAFHGSQVVFKTSGDASTATSVEMYAYPGVVAVRQKATEGYDQTSTRKKDVRTTPYFDRAMPKALVRKLHNVV